MDIGEIRSKIDNIDNSILNLLVDRFNLIGKDLVEYKVKNGINVRDRKREEEIIQKKINEFREKGYGNDEFIRSFFQLIFDESSSIQENKINELKNGNKK